MKFCISEVSEQTVAIIGGGSLPLRFFMIHPRGQEHHDALQTRARHSAPCPAQVVSIDFPTGRIELKGLQLHQTLQAHLSDVVLSDCLACHMVTLHIALTQLL